MDTSDTLDGAIMVMIAILTKFKIMVIMVTMYTILITKIKITVSVVTTGTTEIRITVILATLAAISTSETIITVIVLLTTNVFTIVGENKFLITAIIFIVY